MMWIIKVGCASKLGQQIHGKIKQPPQGPPKTRARRESRTLQEADERNEEPSTIRRRKREVSSEVRTLGEVELRMLGEVEPRTLGDVELRPTCGLCNQQHANRHRRNNFQYWNGLRCWECTLWFSLECLSAHHCQITEEEYSVHSQNETWTCPMCMA